MNPRSRGFARTTKASPCPKVTLNVETLACYFGLSFAPRSGLLLRAELARRENFLLIERSESTFFFLREASYSSSTSSGSENFLTSTSSNTLLRLCQSSRDNLLTLDFVRDHFFRLGRVPSYSREHSYIERDLAFFLPRPFLI
jgi:hypothetical protein